MKLQTNLALILIFLASSVNAETFVYITDQVDIPIRSEKSLGNTIIRLLPSGTKLSLIQITEDGWTEVKYQDTTGWVSSRYLSNKIAAREELKQANRVISAHLLRPVTTTASRPTRPAAAMAAAAWQPCWPEARPAPWWLSCLCGTASRRRCVRCMYDVCMT